MRKRSEISGWVLIGMGIIMLVVVAISRINEAKQVVHIVDGKNIGNTIAFELKDFLAPAFLMVFGIIILNNDRRNRLERSKLHAENDKIRAEFQFLKAQINPHFLYNTLNFFYSKALPVSDELSDGILTLSEIMRYSLSNEEDDNGLVPLYKEIEQINNFIHINKLRFGERFSVEFNIKGDPSGKKIVPLVLITLVENAFKHGDCMNVNHPVKINLDVTQMNGMVFSVENNKKTGSKDKSHGIGLVNIRKQLDWVYKSNYTLAIRQTEATYIAQLRITYIREEIFFPVNPFMNNLLAIVLSFSILLMLFGIIRGALGSTFWQSGQFLMHKFVEKEWSVLVVFALLAILPITYFKKYRKGGGVVISKYGIEFRAVQLMNLNIDWEDITAINIKPFLSSYLFLIKVKSRKKYMKRLTWFETYFSGNLFSLKKSIRLNTNVLKEDKDYVLSVINKKWEEYKKQREMNRV